MKKTAIFLLSIFSCYRELSGAVSDAKQPENQTCTAPVCLAPAQMVLSHNFGRGVGHKGYSSIDFFFIQARETGFLPFADVRFHVMDEGRLALNSGIGFRQLTRNNKLSLGANLYYDYRNSSQLRTNQLGGGFELLSQHIDFRLNGYVPLSGKKEANPLKFVSFSGHQINVRRNTHYAFPSLNAELGIPLTGIASRTVDYYIGIGPYYLFGENVSGNRYPNSWGGKLRLEMNVTDYVSLKFELNQDRIFHTTCQGVVAINIPLSKKTACIKNCSNTGKEAYFKRTLRPVMRNEIIPVKKKSRTSALKDSNGNIYQAFFVNNLAPCPGTGAFESPFCTLAGASIAPEGPVLIYVFEGNSPVAPYLGGFTMKSGQTLQGSGTPLTLEDVFIPPFTTGSPVITSLAAPAVTVASSTTVQGLNIQMLGALQNGIFGQDVNNVSILHNTVNQAGNNGIEILNFSGNLLLAHNVVTNSLGTGISIDSATNLAYMQIIDNTVIESAQNGILAKLNHPLSNASISFNTVGSVVVSPLSFDIGTEVIQGRTTLTANQLNSNTPWGIHALDGNQTLQNNVIHNTGVNSVALLYDITSLGISPRESYIYNNVVNVTDGGSIGIRSSVFTAPGFLYTEIFNNNSTSTNLSNGILVEVLAPGVSSICASITGNTSGSIIRVDGQQGPVNVQQTLAEYTNDNNAPVQALNTVNFGVSCTAP